MHFPDPLFRPSFSSPAFSIARWSIATTAALAAVGDGTVMAGSVVPRRRPRAIQFSITPRVDGDDVTDRAHYPRQKLTLDAVSGRSLVTGCCVVMTQHFISLEAPLYDLR